MSDPDTLENRIECRAVDYRSGFVEVGVVHPGLVNLETWNIDPDKIAAGIGLSRAPFPEGAALEGAEIEMTVAEARRLIVLLTRAIEEAEADVERQA